MAYKFQLGDSKLGGSIVLGGDATLSGSLASSDVDDATAANIVAEIDDKEIPHTKVALEDGDLLIGDGSGVAQNQTVSGDATLASNGALTIEANAISNAKLAGMARGTVKVGNASGAASDLDAKTAGRILVGDGNDVASVAVSGDAALASNGALTIEADAVTYAKIQDVSATNRILGRDSAGAGIIEEIAPAALRTMINVEDGATADQTAAEIRTLVESATDSNVFTDDDHSKLNGIEASADVTDLTNVSAALATLSGTDTLYIGDADDDATVVIRGTLQVDGTTTTVNSTTVLLDDHNIVLDKGNSTSAVVDGAGFTLEGGSGDDLTFQYLAAGTRMELKIGSSYADLRAGTVTAALVGNASTATTLQNARTIGGVSFNGSADIVPNTISVADDEDSNAQRLVLFADSSGTQQPKNDGDFHYNPSNGTLTATAFSGDGSDLTGLPAGNPIISAKTGNGATPVALSLGVNVLTLGSDAHHVFALPNSAANGDRIWIKNPSNASADRTANITGSAGGPGLTVEGAASIRLESPGAAVCLVYVGANSWVVF